jgi:hypothetical protein
MKPVAKKPVAKKPAAKKPGRPTPWGTSDPELRGKYPSKKK